jgi:hypothetical protein
MKPYCKGALRVLWILFVGCSQAFAGSWTIDKPGNQEKTGTVKCGTEGAYSGKVDVFTGVEFTGKGDRTLDRQLDEHNFNGISLAYKGSNCKDCTWVQFIWRERYYTSKGGKKLYDGDPVPKSEPYPYDFTNNSQSPNWHVDSKSASDPTLEGGDGAIIRDADSITFLDQPGVDEIKKPPNPNVAMVTLAAHFNTFLVCDDKTICAKVTWVATQTWTPKGGTSHIKYSDIAIETPGDPPTAAQKAVMNNNYSDQKVMQK